MAKKKSKCFIGIDVSKQQLEVAVHQFNCPFRCANKVSAFWRPDRRTNRLAAGAGRAGSMRR